MVASLSTHPRKQLEFFISRLLLNIPFTFIRFSDGELEILNSHPVEISHKKVSSSFGESNFEYPSYDFKRFDPVRDSSIREQLLASIAHNSPNFFKGVPARSNQSKVFDAIGARELCASLSGGSENFCFADLFVNSNYMRFRSKFVPAIRSRPNLYLLGNFRMNAKRISEHCQLIPLPDNFFGNLDEVKSSVLAKLNLLPESSLLLSSASSLSNIVGHELSMSRPDLTFLDIGTALHHKCEMPPANRLFQALDFSRPKDLFHVVPLLLSRQFWLKW